MFFVCIFRSMAQMRQRTHTYTQIGSIICHSVILLLMALVMKIVESYASILLRMQNKKNMELCLTFTKKRDCETRMNEI